MTEGRPDRRPSWDEVQEWQRRHQARLDAERDAADKANPQRPRDRWRISGDKVRILRLEHFPTSTKETPTP